jgi:hypothetical protein
MLRSPLGLNFFALSSEYRKIVLDEIYYLAKNLNFSYGDLIKMPTFERKYFINKFSEEIEKRNEELSKRRN